MLDAQPRSALLRPAPWILGVGQAMTRIVTTTYRYKRPPRKRKAVALVVESTPMMETGGASNDDRTSRQGP